MSSPSATGDTRPAGPDSFPDDAPTCPPGYELLDEVGRGGMGIVYRAKDLSLDREIALKFLQARYSSGSPSAARFVEEARITGQLQHPGIPPIHQFGALPDGRPYLAMKLIRGRTLAERIEAEGPHPTRWLDVFEKICQAVGYAHANGVIHRDLKPANVMVGSHGEVQVMDWGLAKVLGPSPAARPAAVAPFETIDHRPAIPGLRESDGSITQAGSVLGTPQFMPPEQAAGEIEKISERTDVFGLGAVLCVLLTGQPPFEGATAETTRLNAVRGRTDAAFARLDACGAEPDVIALCKRCLAFEPEGRPARGSELAEAVAALRLASEERAKRAELDRATTEVRLREGARRRKLFLVAAGVVAGILGLGIVGTTWGLYRAESARTSAVQAQREEATQRALAESEREAADGARRKAQSRLETALAIVDRMTVRVNGTHWALNPELQAERREIIEDAVRLIAELAGDDSRDPRVRREIAKANLNVGEMYMLLGRHDDANRALEQAKLLFDDLMAEQPENADLIDGACLTRTLIGGTASLSAQFPRAAINLDQAYQLAERASKLEPTNLDHKRRMLQAATARTYLHLTNDPAKGAASLPAILGFAREIGGKPDAPFETRFELGFALMMAGTYSLNAGNFPEANRLYREADGIFRSLVGQRAPSARYAERLLQSRAMVAVNRGLVDTIQAKEPDEYRHTADDLRQAIVILDGLLAIQPKTVPYQIQKLQGMNILAQIANKLGDNAEFSKSVRAIRSLENEIASGRPNFDWVRQIGLRTLSLDAVETARAGRWEEAVREIDHLMQIADGRHRTYVKYNGACVFALASGQVVDPVRREEGAIRSIGLLNEVKAEGYFRVPANVRNFERDADFASLRPRDDWRAFSLDLARYSLAEARKRLPTGSAELANELAAAGKVLLDWREFGEAEAVLRDCLAIREKAEPNSWTYFNARSLLGAALAGRRKSIEAEPFLEGGFAGLAERGDDAPANSRVVFEAANRLMEFYLLTGKAEKATALRPRVPREPAPAPRPAKSIE